MDPITDIFRTLHVTAVVHSRLEATAPWGLMREAHIEEKITPSGKRISPTELAHFGMVSRGNCWLSVEGLGANSPHRRRLLFAGASHFLYSSRPAEDTAKELL